MGLLFENRTCPRCGGSGNYSYCSMYGSRCFKCGGAGAILTKRGRAAQLYLNDLRKVRADELQIGDEIMEDPTPYISAGGWAVVKRLAIEPDPNTGERFVVETDKCSHYTYPADRFRLRRSKAAARVLIQQALDYQATLTKTGKEGKKRVRKAA